MYVRDDVLLLLLREEEEGLVGDLTAKHMGGGMWIGKEEGG